MSENKDVTEVYKVAFQPLVDAIHKQLEAEVKEEEELDIDYIPVLSVVRTDYSFYSIKITSTNHFRSYFNVLVCNWSGCCALTYLSSLQLYTRNWVVLPEITSAIKETLMDNFMRNKLKVHRTYFSYSDEEISYQDKLAKLLGFKDSCEPYVSVKTGNMIHTTFMDVYNKGRYNGVLERRAARLRFQHAIYTEE